MRGPEPPREALRPTARMKRKVLFGVSAWVLFVTLAHLYANVGFAEFGASIRDLFRGARVLQVGYLPVT